MGGLTLALPVSLLVGIVDSTDLVNANGEGVPWLRGRLCYPHGEIQVADTAHWVLPPSLARAPTTRHYPVLVIAGGHWGLACDGVGAVVSLNPAAVRWRSARTQSPDRPQLGLLGRPGPTVTAVGHKILFD